VEFAFVMFTALAIAALFQTAPAATGPVANLMAYEDVVRCAGLSQAASELEGAESEAGSKLFDAALYWSLAASQAAQAAGRDPVAADRDQTLARIEAVRRLTIRDAEAATLLQRCRQRTPDLG